MWSLEAVEKALGGSATSIGNVVVWGGREDEDVCRGGGDEDGEGEEVVVGGGARGGRGGPASKGET